MGKVQAFWAKSAGTRVRGRLGAIAVLLVDALLLAAFLAPGKARPADSFTPRPLLAATEQFNLPFDTLRDSSSPSNTSGAPALYSYSVIPGGARTSSELRNAVEHDSTVRAHYTDFVVANTRVTRLQKPQAFYVSYRVGNNIFWTTKTVLLPAGETVLSDGTHLARTRCGNRLALAPAAPISKTEPAPEAMEAANPAVLLANNESPFELPIAPPPMTSIEAPPATPVSSAPPLGFFFPGVPFTVGQGGTPTPPPGGGGPVTPGTPATPPPPSGPPPTVPPGPPTPPISAAEPAELLMLAAGLAGIFLLKKSR
jgi:hypothetical protein